VFWALKGNNTFEFWQYVPWYSLAASAPKTSQVASNSTVRTSDFALRTSPNPFRTATSISFALPKAGNVSLKLYDVTGSLVMTLANGYADAGSYSTQVNSTKLAHGIYLLKLATDERTITQKLILE
jgi:hypothetical protein